MNLGNLREKYGRWLPIAFFVLGFAFDALVLRRIDELITLVQQAVYISICAGLIAVEITEASRSVSPPRFLSKAWAYREALLHFLMGTLLNAYTIFYFKSASALTSLRFIAVLAGLLIANEFKRFGRFQTQVHIGILSLCLISYFGLLAPIVMGYLGSLPFLIANAGAVAAALAYRRLLAGWLALGTNLLRRFVLVPFFAVQFAFVVLYITHVIPPVPLSVSYMGIYHDVQREGSAYALTYNRPEGMFWEHGDQTFLARTGDTIFCFVRIFAPTRFKDRLQVRWLFHDPSRGWVSSDAIDLAIVGGREEGYRGVTKKSNYQPGAWRIQVETMDGREVGRINFTVETDASTEPRDERIAIQ